MYALNGRDVHPVFIIFIQTSRALFPVGKLFVLVGTADEEAWYHVGFTLSQQGQSLLTSNLILCRDHKQTVICMGADASALPSFTVSCGPRRKPKQHLSVNATPPLERYQATYRSTRI